jgi:hypothetical protein
MIRPASCRASAGINRRRSQVRQQANEAALAVIAAEVDLPHLIEELHKAHARRQAWLCRRR